MSFGSSNDNIVFTPRVTSGGLRRKMPYLGTLENVNEEEFFEKIRVSQYETANSINTER